MDRLIFVILFLGLAHVSSAAEFFGGLTEFINYESTLPCEAKSKKKCFATNGLMGLTLDTASGAGLDISSVLIKENKNIFVKTKKHGTCLVDVKSKMADGPVAFRCSSKGIINGKLKSVDKIFTLNKKSDKNFQLQDVTSSQKVSEKL